MKKITTIIIACAMVLCIGAGLAVDAQLDKNELAESISLPAVLLKGHSYTFFHEEMQITVNGQPCPVPYVAEGEQVTLAYTDNDGNEIASYTLKVADTKDSTDHMAYFHSVQGVKLTEMENEMVLSAAADGAVSFAKELNADNFGLNINLPREAANCGAITVALTDSCDATVCVTVRIDLAEKKISAGGESAKIEVDELLQLRYKNLTKYISSDDTQLLKVSVDDSGKPFEGFARGVYMRVGFEQVSGNARIGIARICNQSMGHKNGENADIAEPAIVLSSALQSTQYMGQTFQIPGFVAYDVYSPIAETSITVELPDGTKTEEPFEITQYGRYKIVYSAEDSLGNKGKTNKIVFVNDDVAPELTVEALEKKAYSLGDAVTIPAYTAQDNLGQCVVDVILLLPNGEIRLLTHEEEGEIIYSLTQTSLYNSSFINDEASFKTEQKGQYIIRYVAYDDQFNRAVQELTFQVD